MAAPDGAPMRFRYLAVGGLWAALTISAPVAAHADGAPSDSYSGGLKLVWGGLAVPDFSGKLGNTTSLDPPPGFAMMLTMPNAQGQQFMFSPRLPQVMPDSTTAIAGQRAYLGFSFDMGQQTGFYGTLGLGGSVATTHSAVTFDDLARAHSDSPLMFHGGLELGYRPDPQNSVSLSLDQAKGSDGFDRGDSVSSVRLRYGLKF
jgi:hypothetical protein